MQNNSGTKYKKVKYCIHFSADLYITREISFKSDQYRCLVNTRMYGNNGSENIFGPKGNLEKYFNQIIKHSFHPKPPSTQTIIMHTFEMWLKGIKNYELWRKRNLNRT